MDQIHKRFNSEQVRNLFRSYCQGLLDRDEIENILAIAKARFFVLLRQYRKDPEGFSISYQRNSPLRLTLSVEKEIKKELILEKSLIEDHDLPISSYNYSAIRDRLLRREIKISVPTIIERAKALGCYRAKPKKKAHDREVVTTAIEKLSKMSVPSSEKKYTNIIISRLRPQLAKFLTSYSKKPENQARLFSIPFSYPSPVPRLKMFSV